MSDKPRLWIFILCTIYIILSIFLFDPKLFTGGDNARYIILTESLINGRGYRDLSNPAEPAYTLYPPGFPLLLLPAYFIGGGNFIILKLIPLLCGIGVFVFSCLIYSSIFRDRALNPAIVCLSVPILIINNHWIMSEIPFLCFSLASIYFFLKALESNKHAYISLVISSLLGSYAVLIRSVGVILIGAMIIHLIFKRHFKYVLITVCIFLTLVVPWTIRNASIPGSNTYDYWFLKKDPYVAESPAINFPDLINRVIYNFKLYTFSVTPAALLSVVKSSALLAITGTALLILMIIGLLKKIKKFDFVDIYLVLSAIIIITWTEVWSSERFLLPVIPLLIIYIYHALFWLEQKLKSKHLSTAITVIFALVNLAYIVPGIVSSTRDNARYFDGDRYSGYTPDWRRYFEAVEWIKKNIPEDRIIMARKPEFVYLLSRHKSLIYPFTENRTKVQQAIDQCNYILLDNFYWTQTTRRYLWPVLQQSPERYEIVHQTRKPEFYVLKIDK